MRARVPLVDEEIDRYRALGRDIGVSSARRAARSTLVRPKSRWPTRRAPRSRVAGARPIVVLVAADERLARYRHPVADERRLAGLGDGGRLRGASRPDRGALANRVAGTPTETFSARMRATAQVFAQLLNATRPGTTGAELYEVAAARMRRSDIPAKSGAIIRAARPATARASGSRTRSRRRSSRATGVRVESEHHGDQDRRHDAGHRRPRGDADGNTRLAADPARRER